MDGSHDDDLGPLSSDDVAAAASELDRLAAGLTDDGADVEYPTMTPPPAQLRIAAMMLERHADGANTQRRALEAVAAWLQQLAREHELRSVMEERRRRDDAPDAIIGATDG